MPSQNWYFQNAKRNPVSGQDYLLLGNLIDTDPGGPLDTAAADIHHFRPTGQKITTNHTVTVPNFDALCDTTSGPIAVTLSSDLNLLPVNSVVTIAKITNDGNFVTIDADGQTLISPISGTPSSTALLIDAHDIVTYIRLADGWYLFSVNYGVYSEAWTIPVDTDADNAGAPLPLTFSLGPTGQTELFTSTGTVLTSIHTLTMLVDIQYQTWITLTGNNNSARVLFEPVTTGISFVPRAWASQGASRAESFPNTISASGVIEFSAGDTFQINSTLYDLAGANLAQLGSTVDGDSLGAFVNFSVAD